MKDNDNHSQNCVHLFGGDGGGWWFNGCMHSNLNGKNYNRGIISNWNGIYWYSSEWSTQQRSLKSSTMAIRPNNV